MKVFRLLIVAVLVLALASCQLKPMWDIAGKWQKVDSNEIIEFGRNGTLQFTAANTALSVPYKFSDPKHLQIDLGIGTAVFETTVAKDTLTVKDAQGNVTKFTRVK